MTKGQITIRVIAGGYLAYIGFKLARDSILQKPEHYMIFVLFAVVFMVLGGIWCIMALKRYMKGDFKDGEENIKDGKENFEDGKESFEDGEESFKDGEENFKEDISIGEDEDTAKTAGEEVNGKETEGKE